MQYSDAVSAVTVLTAIATAVVGGVFFAFSSFVMIALTRLPPAQGLVAMQSINVVVINPLFMALLFVPALACIGLAVDSLWDWQRPGAAWRLAGSLAYSLGVIGMTIAFHVPRNDTLAKLSPTDATALTAWTDYAAVWTSGNHVRTVCGIAAAALLLWGWSAETRARDGVVSITPQAASSNAP